MNMPLSGHVPSITWFTATCLLISNIVGGHDPGQGHARVDPWRSSRPEGRRCDDHRRDKGHCAQRAPRVQEIVDHRTFGASAMPMNRFRQGSHHRRGEDVKSHERGQDDGNGNHGRFQRFRHSVRSSEKEWPAYSRSTERRLNHPFSCRSGGNEL